MEEEIDLPVPTLKPMATYLNSSSFENLVNLSRRSKLFAARQMYSPNGIDVFSAEFIEDVRRVLGVPEWMLLVDARQTRDIQNGRCVQFKVHFYGPVAGRIERDLSHLLSKGQLDSPTIQVHGSHADPKRSKTIPYHVCDESDNGI